MYVTTESHHQEYVAIRSWEARVMNHKLNSPTAFMSNPDNRYIQWVATLPSNI